MTLIAKVYTNSVCTQSHRGQGSYAEWSATYIFKVVGAVLVEDIKQKHTGMEYICYNSEVFSVPAETKVGDDLYVVSVHYNSGDSFGRSTGNGEAVFATTKPADARLVEQAFNKDDNGRRFSFDVVLANGESVMINNPAAGYFERLTDVTVDFVQLRSPDQED